MQVRSLFKHYENLDKTLLDTAESFLEGIASSDEFAEAIGKAKGSASAFGAALKSTLSSMAIMAAVSLAIKGALWLIDIL